MSSRGQRTWSGNIEQPSDLWDLEHYLTESRKRIDRPYDYRYSVLTDVFGRLIREGRLSEKELQGLGEDKLESIRSYAKLLAKLRSSARSTGTVISKPAGPWNLSMSEMEEVGLKPGGS